MCCEKTNLCCGLPLVMAASLIAISDVIFGSIGAALFSYCVVNSYSKHNVTITSTSTSHSRYDRPIPIVLLYVLVGFAVLQILLGMVLLIGVGRKSTCSCLLWMYAGCICIFFTVTGALRISGMRVVYAYYTELSQEKEIMYFKGHQNTMLQHQHQSISAIIHRQPQHQDVWAQQTSQMSDGLEKARQPTNGNL